MPVPDLFIIARFYRMRVLREIIRGHSRKHAPRTDRKRRRAPDPYSLRSLHSKNKSGTGLRRIYDK